MSASTRPSTTLPAQTSHHYGWLVHLLCWGFGLVFIYAGALKALDPGLFVISVRSFRILPDPFAAWLALFLPWLEIFCGLSVLTGWLRRGGLILLNITLAIFALVLFSAWGRGLDVECGCFGGQGGTTVLQALARDIILLIVGVWLQWRVGRGHATR